MKQSMRKPFTLFILLCLAVSSVMADSRETITVGGQVIEKDATRITFSGDNVTLFFTDGSSQSQDMHEVSITFDYVAPFNGVTASYDNLEVIKTFGGKTVGAKVTLALNAGQWNSICLPFDMTEEDIISCFGPGTKVAVMESSTTDNINFTSTTEMKGGTPYLIAPARAASAFSLDQVTIGKMGTGSTVSTPYFSQTGTINSIRPESAVYRILNGKIEKLSSGTAISPLSAYFTGITSDSDLKTFTIDGESFNKIIGDVNGDGQVNVSDIMAIVNHILGSTPTPFIYENANVNGDETITVSDIMGIVNIILNQ